MPDVIKLSHPGFVWVLLAELYGFSGLEFTRELKLTAESLRIDAVVVMKDDESPITKNIAAIFRGHNLIEYKSPTDGFDVKDLMKTFTYVFLYLHSKDVSIHDITLSIVLSKHPVNMIAFLKNDLGVTLTNTESGIYRGEILGIPLQVIECQKLESKTNLWLHSYTSNASIDDITAVMHSYKNIKDVGQLKDDDFNGLLASYLRTMIDANPDTCKEVFDSMDTAEAKKIISEAKAVKEIVDESLVEGYCLLVRNGMPIKKLTDYGVDEATVKKVREQARV